MEGSAFKEFTDKVVRILMLILKIETLVMSRLHAASRENFPQVKGYGSLKHSCGLDVQVLAAINLDEHSHLTQS